MHFAEDALGLSGREARELLRIARALEELPEIDRAFAVGRLGWSKVREITRVATVETEKEWLHFARRKRAREVEWAVSRAKRGEKPPAAGLGTPRVTFRLQYDLPAELHALWQVALAKLMEEGGEGATPLDALKLMAELAIRKEPEGQVEGRRDRKEPVYTVVYHVAPDGRSAWVEGEEGRVPIPLRAVAEAQARGRAIEARDLEDPGDTRAIRFGKRGCVPPEERDAAVTESVRTAVLSRDGQRCAVCRGRRDLRVHHLESLANGGKTRVEYLVSLCLGCHSRAHEGFVELQVNGEGRLVALDREGSPLLRGGAAPGEADDGSDLTVIEVVTPEAEKDPRGSSEASQVQSALDARLADGVGEDVAAHDPRGSSAALPAVASLDDLPVELTAAEWRSIEGQLEWSARRRLYVLRPELEIFPGAVMQSPRGPQPARRDTADRRPENGGSSTGSPLRPPTLAGVVGQERVVRNLGLAARAARERGEPLGHVLLSGPAGLGKTTLARALAAEMGARLYTAVGPLISEPQQLVALLSSLGERDVVFIDEVHSLSKSCEECLYGALEDGVVDVLVAQGSRVRTARIVLSPFTLVGATTEPGALTEPFRARFKLEERLAFYAEAEIAEVVARAAPRLGTAASPGACTAIARRARGTPREALRLLERARDLAQAGERNTVEAKHAEEAAARLEIDAEGLRAEERRILETLIARGRPMGIEALAATLRLDPLTLRCIHEPYLVERGYVVRTSRGREATRKARRRFERLTSRGIAV